MDEKIIFHAKIVLEVCETLNKRREVSNPSALIVASPQDCTKKKDHVESSNCPVDPKYTRWKLPSGQTRSEGQPSAPKATSETYILFSSACLQFSAIPSSLNATVNY